MALSALLMLSVVVGAAPRLSLLMLSLLMLSMLRLLMLLPVWLGPAILSEAVLERDRQHFCDYIDRTNLESSKIVGVDKIFDLLRVLDHLMMVPVHGLLVRATLKTRIVLVWSVLVQTLASAAVDRGKRLLLTEGWQGAGCGGRG